MLIEMDTLGGNIWRECCMLDAFKLNKDVQAVPYKPEYITGYLATEDFSQRHQCIDVDMRDDKYCTSEIHSVALHSLC